MLVSCSVTLQKSNMADGSSACAERSADKGRAAYEIFEILH